MNLNAGHFLGARLSAARWLVLAIMVLAGSRVAAQTNTVITTISPTNGPTTGGTVVSIMGTNFGPVGTVTLRGVSCAVSSWTGNDVICTTPPGQGPNLPLVVLAENGSATNSQFSYNPPSLGFLNYSAGPTSGGTQITLNGSNFGTNGVVTLGGIPCASASWSNNQIVFITPAGQGTGLAVQVTVSGQSSATPLYFNYLPPAVYGVNPATGPTAGGTQITITGTNFGVSGSVTMGGVSCPQVTWTNNQIVCTTPAGQGLNVPLVVTVSQQTSTPNTNFSYAAPIVTGISPATGPTVGGTQITVAGNNFGISGSVALGGNACAVVTWANNQIVCTTPAGQGINVPLAVMVAGQASPVNNQFSYAAPIINSLNPTNGPTAGGTTITITGVNFGTNGAVTLGPVPCSVLSWTDDQIVFTTPPGVGIDLAVQVSVSRLTSVTPAYFSYFPPLISGVSPVVGPTAGGTQITITGDNFGASSDLAGGFVALGGISCSLVSWTNNQIVCTTPPGQGIAVPLVVFVEDRPSPAYNQFSYAAPIINSLSPTNGPTTGGTPITLTGVNFGTNGSVTLGEMACPVVSWTNSQIVCTTPPGVGVDQAVQVTVGVQASVTPAYFSYSPPMISGVTPAIGPTAGGTPITITGINFGPSDAITEGAVTLGGISCPLVSWTNNQIVCLTPPGEGIDLPLVVTIDSQISPANNQFSYAAPAINTVNPLLGPTAGGTQITVTGTNFSLSGFVKIGGVPCQTVSNNDSQIICLLPPGQGANLPLLVTAATQSSPAVLFSYDAPSLNFVNPASGLTSGGTTLTLYGSNFGTAGTVMLGNQSCPVHNWAQNEITCTAPPGPSGNAALLVTVAGQTSNGLLFTYLPLLLTISASNDDAIISWPTAAGGLVLQQNNWLGTNDWVTSPAPRQTNGNTISATVPASAAASFFRLGQP